MVDDDASEFLTGIQDKYIQNEKDVFIAFE